MGHWSLSINDIWDIKMEWLTTLADDVMGIKVTLLINVMIIQCNMDD